MVQITVDTQRDSSAALQHLIRLLQEELRNRGASPQTPPIAPPPFEPLMGTSEPAPSSAPKNTFTDMFGSNDVSSSDPAPSSSSTPDMFAAFSHDAPSNESSVPSYETPGYIDANLNSPSPSTPNASQLLDEDDVEDNTEHLARQVWQTGSTRKPESSFKLEPYDE